VENVQVTEAVHEEASLPHVVVLLPHEEEEEEVTRVDLTEVSDGD